MTMLPIVLMVTIMHTTIVELRHLSLQYHAAITSNLHGKERQNPLGRTLHQLPVIYLAKPIVDTANTSTVPRLQHTCHKN
jgi:hypothetical protein